MMIARLTNVLSGTGVVRGSVTWASPARRDLGAARFRVARTDPLYNVAYIHRDAGFLVDLDCGSALGRWRGIAVQPTFDNDGVDIEAMELGAWFGIRLVGRARQFSYCSSAVIVRQGFRDALGGVAAMPLVVGAFCEAGPPIIDYEFRGQAFGDVLGDMSEETGLEWSIVDDVFDWGPSRGAYIERVLCAPSDLHNVQKDVTATDRVTAVVAVGSDGRWHRVESGDDLDHPWYSREEVIDVDTADPMRLGFAANQHLRQRRYPPIIYTADLTPANWSLREGDRVALLLPASGFLGELVTCRVLARTYDSQADTVSATFGLRRGYVAGAASSYGGLNMDGSFSIVRSRDFVRQLLELSDQADKLRVRLGR